MPRKLRLEYDGAIYHVMNRGNRRENIFRDEMDRKRFLATLGEACGKTQWQIHAYCLMRNHFHLSILTDCPHRERLGWLEEAHLNGPSRFTPLNSLKFLLNKPLAGIMRHATSEPTFSVMRKNRPRKFCFSVMRNWFWPASKLASLNVTSGTGGLVW